MLVYTQGGHKLRFPPSKKAQFVTVGIIQPKEPKISGFAFFTAGWCFLGMSFVPLRRPGDVPHGVGASLFKTDGK